MAQSLSKEAGGACPEHSRRVVASVIIPAHNAARTIGDCLQALRQQTLGGLEVIVVDDGSTDETAAVAKRHGAFVLKCPHAGPAAARNAGLKVARGEVVLFTDADCIPTPNWAKTLVNALKQPNVVGAKGTYKTSQMSLIARFAQIEYEEKYTRMARYEFIDFVDTYSAAYKKEVLLGVGGFDTTFPHATGEDAELSFRLAERGHKMVFEPNAVVYHRHPDTLWKYFKRKFKQPYWRLLVVEKHPSKFKADSHTPQTLKLQLLLFLLTVVTGITSAAGLTEPTLPVGVLVVFLVTTIPFSAMAFKKDAAVGLAAPLLLLFRASAFAAGTIAGVIAFVLRKVLGRCKQINARMLESRKA